jgi:pimeloyl-ACP methyl ester carboxylesterase
MLVPILNEIVRAYFQTLGGVVRKVPSIHCTLSYVEFGKAGAKPTLLLIHGIGTSSSTWIRTIASLKDHYHVVMLDLPGHGASRLPKPRLFLSLSQHQEALIHFCDVSLPKKIILCGHSLGGWIGARYAIEHPERVKKVVLSSIAGFYLNSTEQLRDRFLLRTPEEVRAFLYFLWYRFPWYARPFARSLLSERACKKISSFVGSLTHEDFLNEQFPRLRMPVHIIWGENDNLFPVETAHALHRIIPQSTLDCIPRCGHVPQLERGKMFRTILLSRLLKG